MRHGFSLLELSIVLVIIGLLSGGILAGQSLIKAAELRSISREYQSYITAVQSFKDKYFGLPGDMKDATRFWGFAGTTAMPGCVNGTGAATTTPGTCDGNGDGMMNVAPAVSQAGEIFTFWQQLALAGMVEGNFTGIAGPAAGNTGADTVFSSSTPNAPKSRYSNSGWGVLYFNSGGDNATYAHNYGNLLAFGGTTAGNLPVNPTLKPEDAWNIDTKLDDGRPGAGKIWVRDNNQWGNNNSCTTSISQKDYAGQYKLTNTVNACVLWFADSF